MISITLPVSKNIVEIRESITFGEFQAIDNFFANRIKVEQTDMHQKIDVDGILNQQMEDLMVQTFLHGCRGPNNQEISTVGLINTLDVEDGLLLKDKIAEIYEGIKKKQKPKPKK